MATLVTYAANTGVLPDDLSLLPFEQWTMTDAPGVPADPGTTTASVIAGILHIEDDDDTARRIYARYDTLNSKDNAIFEINCQVIRTDPAPGLTSAGNGVGFGFIDTEKSLEVGFFAAGPQFGKGSIFVGAGASIAAVEFTTSDKFHTYRIVKNGNVNMEVWADGNRVLDIPYDKLEDRTSDQRQVVATSGSELSEWDIAYVSYSISP